MRSLFSSAGYMRAGLATVAFFALWLPAASAATDWVEPGGDVSLATGSPAAGAGTDAAGQVEADLDGHLRDSGGSGLVSDRSGPGQATEQEPGLDEVGVGVDTGGGCGGEAPDGSGLGLGLGLGIGLFALLSLCRVPAGPGRRIG